MSYYQKNKNFNLIFRIAAYLIAVIIISFFPNFSNSINEFAKNIIYKVSGPAESDSSIIVINITENDIEKLGAWPLKRSYYALAISNLTKAGAKKIGLEIFLSEGTAFQSVYNDLLAQQIKNAGNVVLGSLVSGLKYNNEKFSADSILYPSPKIENKDIQSGHLNYVKSDGIYIPNILIFNNKIEKSFSFSLFNSSGEANYELLKVNFNIPWESFKKYTLLEFFELSESNEKLKETFNNKIVLIGVSDINRAKNIETAFDNLPGIGIHATALNNLQHNDNLIYQYLDVSSIFILVMLLIFTYSFEKINVKIYYTYGVPIFIILSFILLAIFNIEIDYSAFIVPLFLVSAAAAVNYFLKKNEQLNITISEADILKAALKAKEISLEKHQKELDSKSDLPPHALVHQVSILKEEIEQLRKNEQDDTPAENFDIESVKNFCGIIYKSKIIHETTQLVEKVAPQNATVLITGESGSGKELIASAVHKLSDRKDKNFVAVNCAALTETLLESELFGHVKGAFTNAVSDKKGLFEAADKGTIFLDEIGETNENFQVKLLRVIQTGEYQKVGSSETFYTDVRIVAATNKNLEEQVKDKKFREDLYYRLNVIKIYLPPLRERREDIEPIVNFFIKKENPNLLISKAALDQLEKNDWKGNIRELESVVKRAVIFANAEKREIIKLSDLPEEIVKIDKSNLEGLILESLRDKQFSHTAINETAKELGDISRTIVSENFRGIVFKNYFDLNFNEELTSKKITNSNIEKVVEKVNAKIQTYLKNINRDLEKINSNDFDSIKSSLLSKYKNLPQKYHFYLDEIIKHLISK